MSRRPLWNGLVVVGVVLIVAGAAWLAHQRREGDPAAATRPINPTASGAAARGQTPAGLPQSGGDSESGEVIAGNSIAAGVSGLPRMIDLGAKKCIPCKRMAPILQELMTEYVGRFDIQFIDVWQDPAAGREYGIRVIPTQIFYEPDGAEVWRHEGFLSKEVIVAKLMELEG